MGLQASAGFGRGKKSIAFGTRIRALVPGDKHGITYITFMRYTAAGTAHTGTLMRGLSKSTASAAVAESATSLTTVGSLLDGAGNAIAANDMIAYELANGGWGLDTVSAVSGKTLTITGPAAGTGGIALGGKVVSFGVAGDAGHADYQFTLTASVSSNFPAVANAGPICKGFEINSPILFDSDNATATGTLESISCEYASR